MESEGIMVDCVTSHGGGEKFDGTDSFQETFLLRSGLDHLRKKKPYLYPMKIFYAIEMHPKSPFDAETKEPIESLPHNKILELGRRNFFHSISF